MARSANLEVKLPPHVRPTEETTDQLIKKFLKECSKESLQQYLAEECAWTRRFTKKSITVREKKMRYKRNARKHNDELNGDLPVKQKKKKKVVSTRQQVPQKTE